MNETFELHFTFIDAYTREESKYVYTKNGTIEPYETGTPKVLESYPLALCDLRNIGEFNARDLGLNPERPGNVEACITVVDPGGEDEDSAMVALYEATRYKTFKI